MRHSLAALFFLMPAVLSWAGPRGTTLSGEKTAVATVRETSRYPWTIEKSIDPNFSTITLSKGAVTSVPFTISVTRGTPILERESSSITGQVCLSNTGSVRTQGLHIDDQLEKKVGESWVAVGTPRVIEVLGELDPSTTRCYPYEITGFELDPSQEYRNHARVSIDNWIGSEGATYSFDVIAALALTVQSSTLDETAYLTDFLSCPIGLSCTPSSVTPIVVDTTVIPYTVTITNESQCCGGSFLGENTARIDPVDTHQLETASAQVSILTGRCPANLCYNTGPLGIEEFSYLTVFGLPSTVVNLSKTTITGNLGVSQGGQILDGLPVKVSGATYLHTGVNSPTHTQNFLGGILTNQDLSTEWQAAQQLSSSAGALAPTVSYANWNSALTITGNGGLNVIQVGSVALGSNFQVVLTGTSADLFVINVTGAFNLSGDSGIRAGTGIQPYQILINILGTTGVVNADLRTSIDGIILAPQRSATFHGTIRGNIIVGGARLDMISGVKVFEVCTQEPPCDPILGGLCLPPEHSGEARR